MREGSLSLALIPSFLSLVMETETLFGCYGSYMYYATLLWLSFCKSSVFQDTEKKGNTSTEPSDTSVVSVGISVVTSNHMTTSCCFLTPINLCFSPCSAQRSNLSIFPLNFIFWNIIYYLHHPHAFLLPNSSPINVHFFNH